MTAAVLISLFIISAVLKVIAVILIFADWGASLVCPPQVTLCEAILNREDFDRHHRCLVDCFSHSVLSFMLHLWNFSRVSSCKNINNYQISKNFYLITKRGTEKREQRNGGKIRVFPPFLFPTVKKTLSFFDAEIRNYPCGVRNKPVDVRKQGKSQEPRCPQRCVRNCGIPKPSLRFF